MLRPIVRMPGLRDSPDVSTNSAATYLDVRQSYRYRMPGATTWVALTPVFAGASLAAYRPLDDATGVERVYGAFTRGAVQSITEGVAGHTVVVRMDPLGAGTITAAGLADARAYAQTVPVGATPAALTATGLNGATFLGWFNTHGVEVATTATCAPPAPAADTVLVAKFEPAKVAVTFALVGGDGRFAGNGEASITLPCGIGTAFPSVPAFTYSTAAYVFEGWGHDFPVYVPACATAFTGTLYQTAPRIVRVVPPKRLPRRFRRVGRLVGQRHDQLSHRLQGCGTLPWRSLDEDRPLLGRRRLALRQRRRPRRIRRHRDRDLRSRSRRQPDRRHRRRAGQRLLDPLANHTACTTLNSASLDTYGRLVIRGCDFIGSAGSLYFRSSSYFFTNVIEDGGGRVRLRILHHAARRRLLRRRPRPPLHEQRQRRAQGKPGQLGRPPRT